MIQDCYELRVGRIVGYLAKEKLSFWILLVYFIFEYLRPQSMYPAIDIIPWGKVIIIALSAVFFLEGNTFNVKNVENRFLIIYFIIVILSSMGAISSTESWSKLSVIIIYVWMYFLIVNLVNTEKRLFLFTLFFLLLNFKLAFFVGRQWVGRGFEYDKFGAVAGQGWLENPGEFGLEMVIFFSISIYFFLSVYKDINSIKKFILLLFPLSALASIIASNSRGSILAGGTVLLMIWVRGRKKLTGIILLFIICVGFFLTAPEEVLDRFQNMGEQTDSTAMNRVERWGRGLEMAKINPILGVGYGNWEIADKTYFNGTGALSHNIFIDCASELGYLGLIIFLLMILYTFVNNAKTRKLAKADLNEGRFIYNMAKGLDFALVGFLVGGFFVSVLYYPYFWVNMTMTVSLNNVARIKYGEDGQRRKV